MPRNLLKQPLFYLGLAIRLCLIFLGIPKTQSEWFVPFLSSAAHNLTFDPWGNFLQAGGTSVAFPYGVVMYLAYLPGQFVARILGFGVNSDAALLAFGLTSLVLDFGLLLLLHKLLECKPKLLLAFYWLSPIVLYITYWNGQTDIVPVCLMVAGLFMLKRNFAFAAGVLVASAVSAKLSMVLAAPFFAIYLYRNRQLRALLKPFLSSLIVALLIGSAAFFGSDGFRTMVLGSPEINKVYSIALDFGGGVKLYLLPLVYLGLLYATWHMQRISFELLMASLGISFFAVLLFTPAASGWYMWVVPFLVWFQVRSDRITALLGLGFSLLYAATSIAFSSGLKLPLFDLDLSGPLVYSQSQQILHLHSLLFTAVSSIGLILAIRMYVRGIRRNDYYRLSRKPLAIGIAGDSGAGKDTLALALGELFGQESVANLSGDDYHKWDRHAPMWKALTHLNPRANNLHKFAGDVLALLADKPVLSRYYDHHLGRFRPARSVANNNVIIASGLHALYLPELAEKFDVSIFLDMDEDLRRHFKVERDSKVRGRTPEQVISSIEKRLPDSEQYIRPQSTQADLVFSLQPLNRDSVADSVRQGRLKLKIVLKNGIYHEDITRALIGLCGLHVDVVAGVADGSIEMIVEGDVSAGDLELAARETVSQLEGLLAIKPSWQGGALGIMQYVTLRQIVHSLSRRLAA